MSLAEKVGTGEVVSLLVANLKPGPKIRGERVNLDHVRQLRAVLDAVPPIVVRHRDMVVVDGNHRKTAASQEGRSAIAAVLIDCTDAELLEHAVKANVTHGLPLSASERHTAVARFLKDTDWSHARIAEACGVARATVAEFASLAKKSAPASSGTGTDGGVHVATRANVDTPSDKRTGRDEKSYPADREQQKAAIAEHLRENPDASAREAAKVAGASPTTAAKVKRHLSTVPPATTEQKMVAEFVTMIPGRWSPLDECQRSNAARDFGRFMDRMTEKQRPVSGSYVVWDHSFAPHVAGCPAELRDAAVFVAEAYAQAWARFAQALQTPTMEAMQ